MSFFDDPSYFPEPAQTTHDLQRRFSRGLHSVREALAEGTPVRTGEARDAWYVSTSGMEGEVNNSAHHTQFIEVDTREARKETEELSYDLGKIIDNSIGGR